MTSEDNVRTRVSATGVEIEVQGGAASRIGNALADAISPFTQGLGIAGDQIQVYRVFRQIKAIETLSRAKEIQEKLGIEPHPVSPKLLSQWIEGASLEQADQHDLAELWAMLLAKSPEEFSAIHALCADVLTKLGSLEAQIFQKICKDDSNQNGDEYGIFEAIDDFKQSPKPIIESTIKEVFGGAVPIKHFLEKEEDIKNKIRVNLSSRGCSLLEFDFHRCKSEEMDVGNSLWSFSDGFYEEFGEVETLGALDILSYHNLIYFDSYRIDLAGIINNSPLSVFVCGAGVTSLGAKFALACIFNASL